MADGFVQLPPDAAGKKLRMVGPLADGTYLEVVVLGDTLGDAYPESARFATLTSATLAAGASVDLDAGAITTGTTGKLVAATFAASVPGKWQLKTVTGGTGTVRDVVFTTDAQLTYPWTPPHQNFITRAGGAGNFFRVTVTNQDNIDAADVYATLYWDEVT